MIKIFYGEDRVKAKQEINKFLGDNYEILEGQDLTISDLSNIFSGQSLFGGTRSILIQDISSNKSVFDKLPEYLDTPHKIVIFETKLDKRSAAYKVLKNKVEVKEFTLPQDPNMNLVFEIYKTAKFDGGKAVEMLNKIKYQEDPIRFVGLLTTQAIRDFEIKQGNKEKKALKELSRLDMKLKTTSSQPWLLLQAFLLQVSSW